MNSPVDTSAALFVARQMWPFSARRTSLILGSFGSFSR